MGLEKTPRAKPGEDARRCALETLASVLERQRPFDESFDAIAGSASFAGLDRRDRAFAHALVATSLRHKGEIEAVLAEFMSKPLPRSSGPTGLLLLLGAAQLLFMETAAHAVIDLAVTLAHRDPAARHFAKLINAVLRKVAVSGGEILAGLDGSRLNTPDWLGRRWEAAYGPDATHAIADAHGREAPIDLSPRDDGARWARELGGLLLPTGTIRLPPGHDAIEDLPGFHEGAWWIQDAAARLPAMLLGDVRGKRVLDLCAAPGGKTLQLAALGAQVSAVDKSKARMVRLRENLARLRLAAETIVDDAEVFSPGSSFEAVLLDAPCSATGTIRRHPDLPHIKSESQIARSASLQSRLLGHAATLVGRGGMLVFATCSLEPEEGEDQIGGLLGRIPEFSRLPLKPEEIAGQSQFINKDGDLRVHPGMAIGPERGLDGFFAARLLRR
jgi:16S rRNA (cytosine967-C5)-methyltransferase